MALTEIEREMAKSVARSFWLQKQPTSHEQLLRTFNDPRPIISLRNLRILGALSNVPQPDYVPTILAFEYSGDEGLRQEAKTGVETVIREMKNLFRTNYDMNRDHTAEALVSDPRVGVPIPNQIAVGLFLAKDIPGVFFGTQPNQSNTEITSFRISDHILTLEPTGLWDEYVQTHGTIKNTPKVQIEAKQQKPEAAPAPKKKSDWLPANWRIEESLGEGGQGWTYKVRRKDNSDRKSYVLKRLKNKERLARFQGEIAALTKLRHPGILKIVETSEDSETPFFIAEFCEGSDLGKVDFSGWDLLARLRIFRQVCEAVAAAHGANILHRDLKPPNIFIRKDGSIVVGDFGLCLDLNDAKERATQTSEAVGADRYIAPEVARGRVLEPQATSDVYSLGKVLYFIVGGKTLTREEYAEGEEDLRRTRDAGPAMYFVYELFDKSIRERPQERFQSVADFISALDTVIERVKLKAHILKPNVRQHCMFCVIGEYGPAIGVGGNDLMYVCNNCGNIQRFTGAPSRLWWEQK